MDQVTTFSPHVYVRLPGGELVAFARSSMKHWADVCERMRADRVPELLAEIDASAMEPAEKASQRADARRSIVTIGHAVDRCRFDPPWIAEHLRLAYSEAGGQGDADLVLAEIGWQRQQDVADEIAMLPVVKGKTRGTPDRPLEAGVTLASLPSRAQTHESIGANSPSTSSDTAPALTPAD